jgi:hypothetical protein
MSTDEVWEEEIGLFWNAVGRVFHVPDSPDVCGTHIHVSPKPRKRFSLRKLKAIAFGVIFFEPLAEKLLPPSRQQNKYCKPNTKHSSDLLACYDDENLRLIREQIQDLDSAEEVRDYMQYRSGTNRDRYVLWNFDNTLPGKSGTVEFRGGPRLRDPKQTNGWISFVVAFVHLCLQMVGTPRRMLEPTGAF